MYKTCMFRKQKLKNDISFISINIIYVHSRAKNSRSFEKYKKMTRYSEVKELSMNHELRVHR